MYNVGIDVGSKELVMVIRHKDKNHKARSFNNTHEGHAQIVKTLSAKKGDLLDPNICDLVMQSHSTVNLAEHLQ